MPDGHSDFSDAGLRTLRQVQADHARQRVRDAEETRTTQPEE